MQFIDLKTQYQRIREPVEHGMRAVLERGAFVMGEEVGALEARLAAYCGVEHCIAMSSGTDALLAALMALGVGPGDEVVTTPFSFIATVETIALLGATTVFVDIDPRTYNLDPAGLAAAITPRTKAIVPVSLYGQCADFPAINRIAAQKGVAVIEDAAQSFGARQDGAASCSLTTMACTSFYPAKPLGCYGDGGASFTNDDDLALRMRQIRDHGQDGRYHHVRMGLNARLDTLQAVVLLAKLDIFDEEVAARARAAAEYARLLEASGSGIAPPRLVAGNTSVYAQFTVRVAERERVRQVMGEAGIPVAVHYPTPLHLQPVFESLGYARGDLPRAEAAADEVLSLPMHPYLDPADQARVIAALVSAAAPAQELAANA